MKHVCYLLCKNQKTNSFVELKFEVSKKISKTKLLSKLFAFVEWKSTDWNTKLELVNVINLPTCRWSMTIK